MRPAPNVFGAGARTPFDINACRGSTPLLLNRVSQGVGCLSAEVAQRGPCPSSASLDQASHGVENMRREAQRRWPSGAKHAWRRSVACCFVCTLVFLRQSGASGPIRTRIVEQTPRAPCSRNCSGHGSAVCLWARCSIRCLVDGCAPFREPFRRSPTPP